VDVKVDAAGMMLVGTQRHRAQSVSLDYGLLAQLDAMTGSKRRRSALIRELLREAIRARAQQEQHAE
jgi:metal-responsive CopG/Arc/MetJ family transcriptional regulator